MIRNEIDMSIANEMIIRNMETKKISKKMRTVSSMGMSRTMARGIPKNTMASIAITSRMIPIKLSISGIKFRRFCFNIFCEANPASFNVRLSSKAPCRMKQLRMAKIVSESITIVVMVNSSGLEMITEVIKFGM